MSSQRARGRERRRGRKKKKKLGMEEGKSKRKLGMEAKKRGKVDGNGPERDDLRQAGRISETQKVEGILSSEHDGRWQTGQ